MHFHIDRAGMEPALTMPEEATYMRHMILAACLASLAACGQRSPEVDEERVATNRAAMETCDAGGWRDCRGGFVRYDDGRLEVIVLNGDPSPGVGVIDGDEISSGRLSSIKDDDVRLNEFVMILPSEDGAWEQAAIAHARQRTEPRAEAPAPTEDTKQ